MARRGEHLGELCLADASLRDGIRHVIAEQSLELRPVEAPLRAGARGRAAPKLAAPAPGVELPQRVRFKWEMRPPRLPAQAEEWLRSVEPEQTDKGGKTKKGQGPGVLRSSSVRARRRVTWRRPEERGHRAGSCPRRAARREGRARLSQKSGEDAQPRWRSLKKVHAFLIR